MPLFKSERGKDRERKRKKTGSEKEISNLSHSGSKQAFAPHFIPLRPTAGLGQILEPIYKYSGCKENEMWGRNC
jgi:hypothetical protein